MIQRHSPLSIQPDGTLFQLQWMWQMLRNCTPDRYPTNKERMVRVAQYSRNCNLAWALSLTTRYHY